MGKIKTSREVTASDINCLENLVVSYNTIFLMSSIFIVIIAANVRELFSDFHRILSPTLLLFIIGSFIVFVAGLGFFGIVKKSSSILSLYTMLLIFIFVMEISAGFGILSFKMEIASTISKKMNKAISAYPDDPMTANLVDYVQLEFKCCGVSSFRDWDQVLQSNYTTTCKISDFRLPPSCCTRNSSLSNVNRNGCLSALSFMLHKSSLSITTLLLAICTIQVLGTYFSYSLASSLSKFKTQQTANSLKVEQEIGIPMTFDEKNHYF